MNYLGKERKLLCENLNHKKELVHFQNCYNQSFKGCKVFAKKEANSRW